VLVLRIDQRQKRATLVRSYRHPKRLLSPFEGNAQFLPNGHVFVGWGGWPYISELDRNGRVLFDAYFGHGKKPGEDADTYRAYRFAWRGHPTDAPAVAVANGKIYVSWNGATDVAKWQLLSGDDKNNLRPVARVAKSGFETAILIPLSVHGRYVGVQALDRKGEGIGVSRAVKR